MSRIHNSVNIWFLFNIFLFFFLTFSFYFLFSMNEIFMKCSRCLPQKKNIKVHNSVVCLRGTLLFPAAFLRSWFFCFLIAFSFYFLFSMIDILKFSEMFKMPSKEKKKVHNSVVCLRVHYCFQLLSWGHDFFSIISFTFSIALFFF